MIAGQTDNIVKARTFLRERGLNIALEALFNFILPLIVYDLAKPRLGDVGALLASSAPAKSCGRFSCWCVTGRWTRCRCWCWPASPFRCSPFSEAGR